MTTPQQPPPQPEKLNAGDDTTTPKKTTYSDPSGEIFSMYIARAKVFDDENVENWKGGAESILLFTGLFSSTVATFISMSYPNLQQSCNITTQSLLITISQQLSTNGTSPAASPCTPSPPSASVVFVNSVWFLSLVLSLTCALIATLLQQWTRRYLQMIQRNHAPHVRAHIREFFSRGARRFRIFGLVEALPFLILISVLLFFTGLVVFAFPTNHTVAYITLVIVSICLILYIALTLMPLVFHDCPYHTPFTSLIWYSAQFVPLISFSVLYHGAKLWYDRWGSDGESIVKALRERQMVKAKSFSDGMTSKLESSAKLISMDVYKETLVQTLNWLTEDRDLEKFVAGIPGLCESEALRVATRDNSDTRRTIRDVLAALPGPTSFHVALSGPTSFHVSLPWSVIQLAQRAFTRKLPKSIQQRRTRACLKALYYIPGAIREILTPYASGERHFSEILLLLNTPESLQVIEELWDTPNDDIALSVRCAAAVVTAFMIIPPGRMLNNFSTLDVGSLWDDDTGKKFLTKRLKDSADVDGVGPEYHPRSDSGRLQNIGRFLADIKNTLRDMNRRWWTSNDAELIRRERRALFDTRRRRPGPGENRHGHDTFDKKRDWMSPAFMPAAQQDLIVLTLEILARDPVANVAASRAEAFRDSYKRFKKVALTQALLSAQTQVLPQSLAEYETRARIRALAADSSDMVKRALRPVLRSHLPEAVEMPPLQSDTSPPHVIVQIVPDTIVATVRPDDGPVPEHAAPTQKPPPEQIEAIPSLPYSTASSSAWRQGDAGDSPVESRDQVPGGE